MGRMLRNPEYKAIVTKLLLLFAVLSALLCFMAAIAMDQLQRKSLDQVSAAVGKVLTIHPELEGDIVKALVVPANETDIDYGRTALVSHGYDGEIPVSIDPILGGAYPYVFVFLFLFMLLCATAVLAFITAGYHGIYKQIRSFSESAEMAVDGNYSMQQPSGSEGDFNIFGHRFNQMINRLKLNVEQLVTEKVFLRNTISDISHQLKTPLASLVVYNDLMIDNKNMDTAQRDDFLELSRQQLQRLEWLIQNLLKIARLEAGSIQFRRERVNLLDVAELAAGTLRTMSGEAGVTVCIQERHPDSEIVGDASWLSEAVINILKNGIEHSLPGGAIDIVLDQTPLTAFIIIKDYGVGIAPEDLPHIFERFYRGVNTVKANSIGVGLALSKAIVEGQGGSITVKSEKGRGSEFQIIFLKTLAEQ